MINSKARIEPEFLALISHPTLSELMDSIATYWRKEHGFALATLNLDHIVKMRHQPDFLLSYKSHSHVVADGNPIVWLSRLAGCTTELIPGSDLIAPLVKLAVKHDVPIALFGATEKTLDLAATRLEQNQPGLRVVAKIAPPFGFDPTTATADGYLETIRASGAKLCLVALGAPKQEILAARGIVHVPNCGFVSIGAGLDFIAGSQLRAPHWVRRLALEWFWRMLNNPRRLAMRYGRCILIVPGLTWQALRFRFSR
ncbi:MAG: WecB/TagA/CpsF family glycosyltransferase [Hyphomicrobiales bacterium]